jgi:hypothetical protein
MVLASVLVCAVAVTPALAQGQSGQQGPQVTVTNTAANPVPVVLPSLPLPVSMSAPLQVVVPQPLGVTGTVGISGSVDVTAATPLPITGSVTVMDPANSAYVEFDSDTIEPNWVNTQLNLGSVPAGKRLVVEHVAAACEMAADDEISRASIWILKKAGAGWSSFAVPLGVVSKSATYDGKTVATVSQSLRLYSDGGLGNIFVDVRRRNTANQASCWAVVSGYTVDVP